MPRTYCSNRDSTRASICSRCGGVKPVSVNWLGAFLYFPTPSNCASTPSLSSVPRKNVTSAARPVTSIVAVGDAATFAQPVARKYSRLPADER
jgi:hypothetical protein